MIMDTRPKCTDKQARELYRKVRMIVGRMGGRRVDREELVGEVLVLLLEKQRFEPTWIEVRRRVVDVIRAKVGRVGEKYRRRKKTLWLEEGRIGSGVGEEDKGFERVDAEIDVGEIIERAGLTGLEKKTLFERYWEGRTVRGVAEALGTGESNISLRLKVIRGKLLRVAKRTRTRTRTKHKELYDGEENG